MNDFVDWIAEVSLSAGTVSLSGGANATITSGNYSSFLAAIEPYSFNVIGYAGTDSAIKALFAAFTQRLRDSLGIKFQCVLYQYATANYEGVVSVENNADAVYWTVGALAGCPVNKSVTNAKYDGEYATDYVPGYDVEPERAIRREGRGEVMYEPQGEPEYEPDDYRGYDTDYDDEPYMMTLTAASKSETI